MILITKDEAMAVRAKYGNDAHITIANRQKKGGRKKYYMPEENRLMFFIQRYRTRRDGRKV